MPTTRLVRAIVSHADARFWVHRTGQKRDIAGCYIFVPYIYSDPIDDIWCAAIADLPSERDLSPTFSFLSTSSFQ